MSQVSAGGKVKTHDTVMRTEEGRVDGKVGRRSGVGLYIDAPLVRVEPVGLQGTSLAESFNLIYDFVTSVVTSVGKTLGVFVGEARSETFKDGSRGEVLRSDEFERAPLAVLFLLDQVVQFRILFFERNKSGEWLW